MEVQASARRGRVAAIETRGLEKRYGDRVALRGVDLDVAEGEILGVLGSNGAGKTTLIRILTTLTEPTGGTAKVLGRDVVREADAVRRTIGVVSDRVHLYPGLTAEENLRFFGRLHGLRGARLDARVKDALARVDLWGRRGDRVGALSFGMRKRAEIACALVHDPRVLFMDEATTGLDPQNAIRVRNLARDLAASGMAVVWTTHAMDEPPRLCDRVAILSGGEVRALGRPRDLARLVGREKTVEIRAAPGTAAERVRLLGGVLRRGGHAVTESPEEGVVRVVVPRDEDVGRVLAVAHEFGYVHSANTLEPSLEDVFLHYAREAGKGTLKPPEP